MNEITEAIYAEKVRDLGNEITVLRSLVTVLVFEAGKGKNVSISKGKRNQAESTIEAVAFRELSSGELRFTVTTKEKESKK